MDEFHSSSLRIRPRTVQAFSSTDVFATGDILLNQLQSVDPLGTYVRLEWADLPLSDRSMKYLAQSLGEAALQQWPRWYGVTSEDWAFDNLEIANCLTADDIMDAMMASIRDRVTRQIDFSWLQAVAKLAVHGRTPILERVSATKQIRQLAMALAGDPLVVTFLITPQEVDDSRLMGLANTVQWIAAQTDAMVLLIGDSSLATRQPLDRFIFQHYLIGDANSSALNQTIDRNSAERLEDERFIVKPPNVVDERKLIGPILGRPHPGSPGEMQLFQVICNDEQLAILFQYNIRVHTIRGTSYIVDLMWDGGKVVVEVDGFRYHNSRQSFCWDRERDYELLISGYLVLRLPHEMVMEDPLLAMEKIRDVVNFRLTQAQTQTQTFRKAPNVK